MIEQFNTYIIFNITVKPSKIYFYDHFRVTGDKTRTLYQLAQVWYLDPDNPVFRTNLEWVEVEVPQHLMMIFEKQELFFRQEKNIINYGQFPCEVKFVYKE